MNAVHIIGEVYEEPGSFVIAGDRTKTICTFTIECVDTEAKNDHADYITVRVLGTKAASILKIIKPRQTVAVTGKLRSKLNEVYTCVEASRVQFVCLEPAGGTE